jgi:hypothetical protein
MFKATRTCITNIAQDNSLADKPGLPELLCFGRIRRVGCIIGLPSHDQVREGVARANQGAILGDS